MDLKETRHKSADYIQLAQDGGPLALSFKEVNGPSKDLQTT